MSPHTTQILEQALSLSAQERAELAERLLSSLELSPDPKIDALWGQEVEDRLDAFHQNKISTVPVKQVFESVTRRKSP